MVSEATHIPEQSCMEGGREGERGIQRERERGGGGGGTEGSESTYAPIDKSQATPTWP